MSQKCVTLLSQELLSVDARNDAQIGTEFIAVDHESMARGQIDTDGFFVTKDICMIGTQLIHANDNIKSLNGN